MDRSKRRRKIDCTTRGDSMACYLLLYIDDVGGVDSIVLLRSDDASEKWKMGPQYERALLLCRLGRRENDLPQFLIAEQLRTFERGANPWLLKVFMWF